MTGALTRFNTLKLGQLQLQNTLLRGARFVSFLFGATKLKWIPPYTQDAWCAAIGKPAACTEFEWRRRPCSDSTLQDCSTTRRSRGSGCITVGDIADQGRR